MVNSMKQRYIAFFNIIILLFGLTFYPAFAQASSSNPLTTDQQKDSWPNGPNVVAEAAIVMEASTGLILYEKNIDQTYYPASITKIMTALVAIENSSLSDVVTFSKDAIYEVELDSSRIGIDVGEQLTMQQCLYALLLESANEVTYAVAEHVAGSIPAFADMMNERAKSIGCTNTHFVNPHGLPDEEHVTSARDMALITREAMKNSTFSKIFGTRTYQIPPTNIQSEARPLRNHHKFVLKQEYRYDDCIGGKTGYTSKALYTLVSVAKRGELELISVVLRDDSKANQYRDTAALFDYSFDNFSIYPVTDMENTGIINESVMFTRYYSLLSKDESPIEIDDNGYLVLPNTASFEDAKKEVLFYSAEENTNSKKSDLEDMVIGKISYTYAGKYVGGSDIKYINRNSLTLVQKNIENNNPEAASEKDSAGSLRPWIILCILGLFILTAAIYYIFVELPRLKRRKAYYRKRAHRRSYYDDEFLDL